VTYRTQPMSRLPSRFHHRLIRTVVAVVMTATVGGLVFVVASRPASPVPVVRALTAGEGTCGHVKRGARLLRHCERMH
jgi:hypothetical protein